MQANRGESWRLCGPPAAQQSVSLIHAVANAPPYRMFSDAAGKSLVGVFTARRGDSVT
jgi:hypothetical protein